MISSTLGFSFQIILGYAERDIAKWILLLGEDLSFD